MKNTLKLDRIDIKILNEMQKNARITNQDLADRVCLSPSSCLQRVRRLEAESILVSYHAQVNLPLICRHLVCIATVSMKNHSQSDFRAFEELIQQMPEVVECYTVSGEFDFFLRIVCPDMNRYLEINDQLVSSADHLVNISTHVVMNQNKSFQEINIGSLMEAS